MRTNRGIDREPGANPRKLKEIWDAINALRNERRAAATTISEGDLIVENGGRILVNGGGSVIVDTGILRSRFLFIQTDVRPEGVTVEDITPVTGWVLNMGHLGAGVVGLSSITQPIYLKTATNDVRIDHTTTGSSANAVLDSVTKRLSRSTSSRRYKQNIEDHTVDPARVLKLRPRTWRDRNEVKKDADCERRYVGFIAEELHDLGLTEFVEYDPEGRPDAIAYDRLIVALLALVQAEHAARLEQAESIAALEQTVAELTDAVARLVPDILPTRKRSR